MKIPRFVSLLAILFLPSLAFSTDLQRVAVPARITAVTVYADRALTTRSATLALQPGSYLIAFESLPVLIQDDSVRAEGKGSAGATIAGLEIKRTFLEQDEVKNDGTVTWKVQLQAGEKKELTFGIVVEYPKNREITGL